MNRESSKPSEDSPSPSNKSTARAIRAHPSAQRDRSPVDHLRNETDQPAVGSPQLDAKGPVVNRFCNFTDFLVQNFLFQI